MSATDFPARHRISLCMIVKDEEQKLARCLASAAPWVGEMVVVDTGSTDRTVAIAESFGARVVHFPWIDDFAAARNASLEAATGEWALVLDADEEFIVTDPAELGRAVQQDVFAGISFQCRNETGHGTVAVEMLFRLFRRTVPGMRYHGAIHEQVTAVSEGRVRTVALGCAHIRHDGHTAQAMADRGKYERNLRLAEKFVADRPHDPFAWFCLGMGQMTLDARKVVEALEKVCTLVAASGKDVRRETYMVKTYAMLIQSYDRLNQRARALEAADRALVLYPASPDLRFLRGTMRVAAENFAGAAEDFEAALSAEAAQFFTISHSPALGYASRTGLGVAWLNLGRAIEAEAELRRAVAEAPAGYTEPHRHLGMLLLQRGAWAEALPLLEAACRQSPGNPELHFGLGWCFYKLERYEEAEHALKDGADRPDTQHLLGKVYLEWGQGEQALALLTACSLPSAGLARGWAYYVSGQPAKAASTWEEWLRAGAADWGTKDTLAMFLFLLEGGRRPSGQPERPAEPLRDMDHWFRLLLRYQRFDEVEQVIRRGPELGDRLWLPLRKKWAVTLVQEGFYDVGLQLLLDAQRCEARDPEVYYWLGYCSLHQKQVDDARVMWETCLQLAPGHPLASQALSLLK